MTETQREKMNAIVQYLKHRVNVGDHPSWRESSNGYFNYVHYKIQVDMVMHVGKLFLNSSSSKELVANVEEKLRPIIHEVKMAARIEKPKNIVVDLSPLIIEFSLGT